LCEWACRWLPEILARGEKKDGAVAARLSPRGVRLPQNRYKLIQQQSVTNKYAKLRFS
jgi:hypothetical protein